MNPKQSLQVAGRSVRFGALRGRSVLHHLLTWAAKGNQHRSSSFLCGAGAVCPRRKCPILTKINYFFYFFFIIVCGETSLSKLGFWEADLKSGLGFCSRVCAIERLNGVLKRCFACLKYLRTEPQRACNIIVIVLHNIATRRKVPLCDDVMMHLSPLETLTHLWHSVTMRDWMGVQLEIPLLDTIFDLFMVDDSVCAINVQW